MYAKYTYSAGSTVANILNDVVLILTGTTNKATLSANCDQANTEILTTYNVAGWTLHDGNAGTNKKVISAPNSDVGTKYAILDTGSNAGYLKITVSEDWNSTTHIATNEVYNTYPNNPVISTTVSGSLYIYASPRTLVMMSFQSGTFGCGNYSGWEAVVERERGIAYWDTIGNNYPLSILLDPAQGLCANGIGVNVKSPRVKNILNGADGTMYGYIDTVFKGVFGSSFNNAMTSSKVLNSQDQLSLLVTRMYVGSLGELVWAGDISTKNDLPLLQPNQGNCLDELEYGGKTRVLFSNSATTSSCSYGSILVPKG